MHVHVQVTKRTQLDAGQRMMSMDYCYSGKGLTSDFRHDRHRGCPVGPSAWLH